MEGKSKELKACDTQAQAGTEAKAGINADSTRQSSFSLRWDVILLFVASLFIYLSNGAPISTGDSIPNTVFGFNLLENHRLDFDNFRDSYLAPPSTHWFLEAKSGHFSSAYPLGPSIISFPICLVFWLVLKLLNIPVVITAASFEPYRLSFEHIAASIIASSGVILFYVNSRLLFRREASLITTCVFAFATNTWVTCSQGLWQHGSSNLVLLAGIYASLRANRAFNDHRRLIWLFAAGLLFGLLPTIRPSNAIFVLCAAAYCGLVFRLSSIPFFLGLGSCLPGMLYNNHFFGNLLGGYQSLFSPDVFSTALFKTSFCGSLFSPSRGLFVYSPVLLFSFIGAFLLLKKRQFKNSDEKLILCMTLASLVICSLYFFYLTWWAGHSFGPRFMTEALPMLVFMINYFVQDADKLSKNTILRNSAILAFVWLFAYSTFVQAAGAYGTGGKYWNLIPLNVDKYQWRLWSWHDTQIERHARGLFQRFHPRWLEKLFEPRPKSLPQEQTPSQQTPPQPTFAGKILSINDEHATPFSRPIVVPASATKAIEMDLENTGTMGWLGYESGGDHTEKYACVRIEFEKRTASKYKTIAGGKLYVAGSAQPGTKTSSLGEVHFPQEPGLYKLIARLECEAIAQNQNKSTSQSFDVEVKKK